MSEEHLRAAFADLRRRTQAQVSVPPAAVILRREHRRARGDIGRSVALAGVSALALIGALATLYSMRTTQSPPSTAGTPPTASTASPRSTQVIVYLFGAADAGHPCGRVQAVQRSVLGDGDAETALRSLLDGPTPSEARLGLRSAFTPAVGSSSTVSERGVDLGDAAALRAVPPLCRVAVVSSAIDLTAAANHGPPPTVTMSGSAAAWARYLAGG